MSNILIVPGLHNSGPHHWQSLWHQQYPHWQRVTGTNLGARRSAKLEPARRSGAPAQPRADAPDCPLIRFTGQHSRRGSAPGQDRQPVFGCTCRSGQLCDCRSGATRSAGGSWVAGRQSERPLDEPGASPLLESALAGATAQRRFGRPYQRRVRPRSVARRPTAAREPATAPTVFPSSPQLRAAV